MEVKSRFFPIAFSVSLFVWVFYPTLEIGVKYLMTDKCIYCLNIKKKKNGTVPKLDRYCFSMKFEIGFQCSYSIKSLILPTFSFGCFFLALFWGFLCLVFCFCFFFPQVKFFGVSCPVIIDGFLCLPVHKGLDGRW